MDYLKTGDLLQDDIAALLLDLQDQMLTNKWVMMPIDTIHGFLTAITIGPHPIMPSVWLPRIFFEERELPEIEDKSQAKKFLHTILNVFNGILATLSDDSFSPFISITIDEQGKEIKDFQLWCSGFVLGTCMFDPGEWDVLEDDDLAELCLPMFFLSRTDRLEEIYSKPAIERFKKQENEWGEKLIDAVYDIREYFVELYDQPWEEDPDYDELDGDEPVRTDKVGRNEPCPCGSGKKYKKCCGA